MKCKNVCDLPETAAAADGDGVLVMQNGHAVKMLMSALRTYIGYASGADVLGVPSPTKADAGKVPAVNSAGTGYELIEALQKSGGTMTGTLKVKMLVLTPGTDYGTALPAAGTVGRVYFKKV